MLRRVLLIGTLETKADALEYLSRALASHGLEVEMVDVSLGAAGQPLGGPEKLARMEARAKQAAHHAAANHADCLAAIGLGGGTGGEVVLGAFRGLPARYPKFLVTTLAFDPRGAVADTAITLIPTLCDIEGMNAQLAQVFENAAAMVAGIGAARCAIPEKRRSVAVTTLGATGAAGAHVSQLLRDAGHEATVFHANGYGGAAFARFVTEGRADAVLDLNVHELGRMRLAGAHVAMPDRFTAAGHLPRVVLPGALNFIGLGTVDTISPEHLSRPHYRHSGHFTHVKLTADEMASQARALAEALNSATAPAQVLIPMGGFSHEDRPGGAIEDPTLREIAVDVLESEATTFGVTRLPWHINTVETARAAVDALAVASDTALDPAKRTTDA